ncbi:hypothetical protein EVAR_53445_1 [Eumeta japonica]|uniref:Mos1 transposase HTH domain-containing protein n=1 Tax=Eumeta variegata TaxID=151549 RepID=A0A4C1Y0H1_EUMVA|nr:hypothetical protein EVAR_53445_1 [Eumeta japonica]
MAPTSFITSIYATSTSKGDRSLSTNVQNEVSAFRANLQECQRERFRTGQRFYCLYKMCTSFYRICKRQTSMGAKGTQQSLARLRIAFENEAPHKTTIYNWFAEFKRGRAKLSDEFRDGRPSVVVNNKNIDAVHRMIYHEIFPSLGIGMSQITINPIQTFEYEKAILVVDPIRNDVAQKRTATLASIDVEYRSPRRLGTSTISGLPPVPGARAQQVDTIMGSVEWKRLTFQKH